MNEVEKMYKNAGVEVPTVRLKIFKDDNGKIYTQPPFTAEKQIELIKWLAIGGEVCRIDATEKGKWFVENDYKSSKCFVEFTEALANLINNLWQSLTEEERKQIKEILA
jgi:hypothetical protein